MQASNTNTNNPPHYVGRYSSVGTGWAVRGLNPGGSEIFYNRPDRSWGPPSLLYNGYRVFPGGKADGGWHWPPPMLDFHSSLPLPKCTQGSAWGKHSHMTFFVSLCSITDAPVQTQYPPWFSGSVRPPSQTVQCPSLSDTKTLLGGEKPSLDTWHRTRHSLPQYLQTVGYSCFGPFLSQFFAQLPSYQWTLQRYPDTILNKP